MNKILKELELDYFSIKFVIFETIEQKWTFFTTNNKNYKFDREINFSQESFDVINNGPFIMMFLKSINSVKTEGIVYLNSNNIHLSDIQINQTDQHYMLEVEFETNDLYIVAIASKSDLVDFYDIDEDRLYNLINKQVVTKKKTC